MRRMPEIIHGAIRDAMDDDLNAAVRKQRFEFEGRGRLMVRNVSGDIDVQGWDKPNVVFDRDEGGLWKANEREGMIMAKVLSGDLRVKMPYATSLIVNSVSGDIVVKDAHGRTEVRGVSGDVELRRTRGTLDVGTTSGDIKTRDIEGKCHMNRFRATLTSGSATA